MKIRSLHGISHQGAYSPGFSDNLKSLLPDSTTIHPVYTSLINPMELRRMSSLQKMGMFNAMHIRKEINNEDFGGILIATAMGCGQHTRVFIDKVIESDGQLISPTSFIVSTHNTLAGMVALASHCHNYNITYTHHALSLEHALLDAKMLILEGRKHILVGASDEQEESLHDLSPRMGKSIERTTEGSWFFLLEPDGTGPEITDLEIFSGLNNIQSPVMEFLKRNKTSPGQLLSTLFAGFNGDARNFMINNFSALDYTEYCGVYYTASGFALAMAADILRNKSGQILIINNLSSTSLGLMLISSSFKVDVPGSE